MTKIEARTSMKNAFFFWERAGETGGGWNEPETTDTRRLLPRLSGWSSASPKLSKASTTAQEGHQSHPDGVTLPQEAPKSPQEDPERCQRGPKRLPGHQGKDQETLQKAKITQQLKDAIVCLNMLRFPGLSAQDGSEKA